eukprot:scaffold67085_cov17-Tisochrysis_lutea.AAC.2
MLGFHFGKTFFHLAHLAFVVHVQADGWGHHKCEAAQAGPDGHSSSAAAACSQGSADLPTYPAKGKLCVYLMDTKVALQQRTLQRPYMFACQPCKRGGCGSSPWKTSP